MSVVPSARRTRAAGIDPIGADISMAASYADVLLFSPDGAALALLGSGTKITRNGNQVSISIGSADRFTRIWNLTTGAEYSRVNLGSDVVSGVSFSAD